MNIEKVIQDILWNGFIILGILSGIFLVFVLILKPIWKRIRFWWQDNWKRVLKGVGIVLLFLLLIIIMLVVYDRLAPRTFDSQTGEIKISVGR